MTDIVDRLRAMSRYEHSDLSIGDEAADEIERLRAYTAAAVAAERERRAALCNGVASVCAETSDGAGKSASIATANSCARLIRGA